MRNLYVEERSNSFKGLWQTVSFALLFVFMTSISFAQTAMVWTGAENNRFTNENNWDPAGSPIGNNLTIPIDSTRETPFVVEVTGSEHISVASLNCAVATEDMYQPSVVINMDNDTVSFTNADGSSNYNWTGIILKKGTFNYTKGNGPRLDNNDGFLIVEGGTANFYNLLMGNGNSPSAGGKIFISGTGFVKLSDTFGRMYTGHEDGSIQIIEDGKLQVNGNFTPPTDIWINGGSDYSIKRVYNAISNYTTFSAVPSTYIGIENADRQVLKMEEESVDTLVLIQTNTVVAASTFEWQYRKEGEDTYTSFDGGNTANFAPSFNVPGTFLVSCLVDGTRTENEAEFFVVSNAISFAPAEFSIQFVRIGENGAEMTAQFTTAPTVMEWKYSATPGGPYMSFEPAQTTEMLSPSFTEEGNMYVIMEAVIDGNTHISTELLYNVESMTSAGKSITWTGLVSNEGTNPANWSPVASPYKNSPSIGAFDSTSTKPYPVYSPVGNDTISTFWVGPGATMTIDMEDTLNIRGGWQQAQGELIVENGTVTNKGYFRLDRRTGIVRLKNNSEMIIERLLMGDRSNNGGVFYLTENAKLRCIELPGRVSPDTLESVIYIADNAQVIYTGDQRTTVTGWIDAVKVVCIDEGFEPSVVFDTQDSVTILSARNVNAFAIANDDKTYTTANIAITEPITLMNVDGVTGWEWKYGTNVTGPWMSFDPAVTNEPEFNPSFSESGTYYIVAETDAGVVTTNIKTVVVIDLGITPSDDQEINYGVDGDTLTAVIPEQFTVSAIAWYFRISGTEDAFETGVTDTSFIPNFASVGEYDVFYQVEVQDEFGVQYYLLSSSVHIVVGNVGVNDMMLGSLSLYPNPTTGEFYIKGGLQDNYVLEIIDMTGNVVHKQRYTAGSTEAIEFAGNGVYIVRMTSDAETRIGRLVVE